LEVTAPFESVLIANRGEIAVRIARTCRVMGIRTVAVYSDADTGGPHVRACDVAVRIGPPPARESYLRIDAILEAARATDAQAIHPGYGFLSENPEFAAACAAAGVTFVGPPPAAMRAMGDKITAKKTVEAAGVPTVPGYLGDDQSTAALFEHAKRIGLPLLIKASAGGGGKGMRVVRDFAEFSEALDGAKREALAAFGDQTVFLERYLVAPRHIEVQILADAHGACIHLGERECSIQRRHQKVLEETPSPAVSDALRAEMGAAAVKAAQAVGYVNAGTVEFMLDAGGKYYFLEMNARLQVEHPITEAVTDVDLVREQLSIAAGAPLALSPADVKPRGHAIEVRVYAEDAERDFLPSIGRITEFAPPEAPGLRNDAGVAAGTTVSVDYDPMLAKLIAFDRTRDACIQRLTAALDDYVVGGVTTNIPFLRWVVGHQAFRAGNTTTSFISEYFRPELLASAADDRIAMLAAAAALQNMAAAEASRDPWRRLGPWRHAAHERTVSFAQDEEAAISVLPLPDGRLRCSLGDLHGTAECASGKCTLIVDGKRLRFTAWPSRRGIAISVNGRVREFTPLPPPSTSDATRGHRHHGTAGVGSVEAPMSGKIVLVRAHLGDPVAARDVLVVMEAMKMEHTIVAPYDGTVKAVNVAAGDTVGAGDILAEIEASS
jgi:3-methylcrotonyl-CoA carboxylase alpha subunit